MGHPSGAAMPFSTTGSPRPTAVNSFTPVSVDCFMWTATLVPTGTPSAPSAALSENAITRVPSATGAPSCAVFFVELRIDLILLLEFSTHSTAPAGRGVEAWPPLTADDHWVV